jgi:hypothetical protein
MFITFTNNYRHMSPKSVFSREIFRVYLYTLQKLVFLCPWCANTFCHQSQDCWRQRIHKMEFGILNCIWIWKRGVSSPFDSSTPMEKLGYGHRIEQVRKCRRLTTILARSPELDILRTKFCNYVPHNLIAMEEVDSNNGKMAVFLSVAPYSP